ncbi:B box and SPRY domain-containing protein [Terrapene carolina triunguis]|uniref:B-box and SPRY domain containing n=1 Tax=Terrapene triunguis TaxID=2587831 RepID=A0A674IDK1_9SAUR|nr:B box and SPRY domain-containing protein [Terrapene carolina triunguis]
MAQEGTGLPPPAGAEPGSRSQAGAAGGSAGRAEPERAAGLAGESCPEHGLELGWFCAAHRRLVCAQCARLGGCRGHRVTALEEKAADLRNKIVDQCEKLQLQSAAITKYMAEVLPGKNQSALSAASWAREVVIQRLIFVRNVCENEEQRLLEKVHAEEERTHQSILTQRAHWTESLQKLAALRTYLVDMITNLDDHGLVHAEQEIFERSRCSACTDCLASLAGLEEVHVDEKTVSPLLALSEDKKTLAFSPKKTKPYPDCPERFDHWPNALGNKAFHKGTHAWRISVDKSCAYKLGISYGSLQRKGPGNAARLGYNPFSWVFSRYDKEFRFSHNSHHQAVELVKCPAQVGVLVDLDGGEVLFYDPTACVILHSHREAFTAPIYPVFAVADQSISLVQ